MPFSPSACVPCTGHVDLRIVPDATSPLEATAPAAVAVALACMPFSLDVAEVDTDSAPVDGVALALPDVRVAFAVAVTARAVEALLPTRHHINEFGNLLGLL